MARTSGFIIVPFLINIVCSQVNVNYKLPKVLNVQVNDNGPVDTVVAGQSAELVVYGKFFSKNLLFSFTKKPSFYGQPCNPTQALGTKDFLSFDQYNKVIVSFPAKYSLGQSIIWLCSRLNKNSQWIHQGPESEVMIKSGRHILRRSLIDNAPRSYNGETSLRNVTNAKEDYEPTGDNDIIDEPQNSISSTSSTLTSSLVPYSLISNLIGNNESNVPPTNTDINTTTETITEIRINGMRVEEHSKGLSLNDGSIELLAYDDAKLRLFGIGLTDQVMIQFTGKKQEYGSSCDIATSDVFSLGEARLTWATIKISLPPLAPDQDRWYICVRPSADSKAVHQGPEKWLTIKTYTLPIPLWIQAFIIGILLILSGLFSGLNLGLMALDKTDLKIVSNTGTPKERRYAKAISPVRSHGNFLLCTLLLGNVLVNSTLTILLDNLSTGLIAVLGSTIGIVIFGEIVPQAICSRHGLAIGAKTVWLVRVFMVLTGAVAWPISKILDKVLGEEIGNTYDRERLKELIRVTQDSNDIRLEEQNIICGALELHRKTVDEVMTKIEDVYMLNVERTLDFNTISEIMQQGFSRVPIYDGERTNIISVLFIKDLAFIDPDDNTPLRTLSQFYQNPYHTVFEDTKLDVMFKEFKSGNKGHMAFVHRIINEGDTDPYYEMVGLVTLEDVIEELIQEEIIDETDVFTDNRNKRKRRIIKRRDFKEFSQINANTNHKRVQISPQMQVAAYQFLRTSIDAFKEDSMSENILKRLLTQDIIHVIKPHSKDPSYSELSLYIYVQGKASDAFVLILEGHLEVTIGRDNLVFEAGPFSYYGTGALLMASVGESPSLTNQLSRGSIQSIDSAKLTFTPDFSLKAISEVTYIKIRRHHYIAAKRAVLLQQSQKDPQALEIFEKEMAKIISDEYISSGNLDGTTDKEASVKEPLANGRTVVNKEDEKCNSLRNTHRKKTELANLNVTSHDKEDISDASATSPVSRNSQES